jgi:nicotinamide riboside kinase
MKKVQRICLIGAESTGKTTLAQALARELNSPWVAEYLREFCDTHQRTPRADEQEEIFDTQCIREDIAASAALERGAPFLVCDTAPLLTAVYSDYLFDDKSLYPRAIEWHRRYALTLFTQPDLPWMDDGLQRDGEHVREPVTKLIRTKLNGHRFKHVSIAGDGHDRTLTALRALDAVK